MEQDFHSSLDRLLGFVVLASGSEYMTYITMAKSLKDLNVSDSKEF